MKTGSFILIVFAACLISFGSSRNAVETHVITLKVNTDMIDATNVNQASNFGQGPGISNQEFTVYANRGDIVVWEGESSTNPESHDVLVKYIEHESGTKLFGRNTLFDADQNRGAVVGMINDGQSGDVEKYSVSFIIYKNGEQYGGIYSIDPKIQLR